MNRGLTAVADTFIDKVPMPDALKTAYKSVAPPGSVYHQPEEGTIYLGTGAPSSAALAAWRKRGVYF